MENSRWRLAPTFALAFAIVIIINFYVLSRTAGLLGHGNRWLWLGCAVIMAAMLGAGFLIRTSSVRGTKGLFVAVTTLYGLEFTALPALILYEILQILLDIPTLLAGQIIVIFVAVIAIISMVNAQTLTVKTLRLPFIRKMRVVQLSDVHIGAVHGRKYLARIVNTVNGMKPDLVLITGDVVSGAVAPGSSQLDEFSRLEAPAYLAHGNHEYYEGADEMRAALPTNICILRDEEVKFPGYSIFGLDYSEEQGRGVPRKIDRKFENPTLALAHVPQFLDLPEGSIILAGHYHGGQVFPINWAARLFVKHFQGIYTEKGVTLYVSPGTATWGPPMRFGSRNEITVLELG